MKNKFLVSALVIVSGLVSVSSMAEGSSGKTRDQVRAELAAAIKDGSYPMFIGEAPVVIKHDTSWLRRAQVRAELAVAKKDGTLPEYSANHDAPSAMLAKALAGSGDIDMPPTAAGPLTRQSVMNEFLRAQKEGGLPKPRDD